VKILKSKRIYLLSIPIVLIVGFIILNIFKICFDFWGFSNATSLDFVYQLSDKLPYSFEDVSFEFDNKYIEIYDSEPENLTSFSLIDPTMATNFKFQKPIPSNFEFKEMFRFNKNYFVLHTQSDDSSSIHTMAGDFVYKLNHNTKTAELLFESNTTERVLYACEDYVIVFDINENSCKWVDYENNSILANLKLQSNLMPKKSYYCIFNPDDETLTFEKNWYSDSYLTIYPIIDVTKIP